MSANSNTAAASPQSLRWQRWRQELHAFYEQTTSELQRIAAAIDAHQAALAAQPATTPPPSSAVAWRDVETRSTDPLPAPDETTARPYTPATTQPLVTNPSTISAPPSGKAPAMPPTPASPVADESTSQDRLTLLKQQIAAKLSATPREGRPSDARPGGGNP